MTGFEPANDNTT